MALTNGAQLGSYEITALLGKGGMGEVYRARDLKLKREVAIKILPDEFSRDADRVSRFQREAEVLAALNHPNIANIFDLEEQNGSRYLVLELVEGDTLADRIGRGPIPVDETLETAKQICEALEAAHEKGIIHRDLKPANIKLTPDGKVKVLDFGLAKAMARASSSSSMSNSPTMLSGTMAGMVLGTAAYMSPEQARGRGTDQRSDVFAFRCILYEMLSGRQAFQGEDVSEILASVMKVDVDFNRLPSNLNPRLADVLRRCLAKNMKDRWHAIGDVRFELDSVIRSGPARAAQTGRNLKALWPTAAALFAGLSIVLGVLYFRARTVSVEPVHVSVVAPPGTTFSETVGRAVPVVSPDGRSIVFITGEGGAARLWVRSLSTGDARLIESSDGASAPFWSPDSASVGFFSNKRLYRADIRGGKPQVIASLDTGIFGSASATWNREGTILFGLDAGRPLSRVPAEGGAVTAATEVTKGAYGHFRPAFLPDGKHFLFLAIQDEGKNRVYVGSLDSKDKKEILTGTTTVSYTSSGQLLFVRDNALFAQNFDLKHFDLRDKPVHLADSIFFSGGNAGFSAFSVSETGVLVYRTGNSREERDRTQLTWFDRAGNALETVGAIGLNRNPRLSPDGKRIAVQVENGDNRTSVWILDLGNVSSRFAENALSPIWSSDGQRLVYLTLDDKNLHIVQKFVTAGGDEQVLYSAPRTGGHLDDIAPDGKYVVQTLATGQTNRDVVALPLSGDEKKLAIAVTSAQELYGRISPNGHWVAYASNESGVNEVYVQGFPRAASKVQISRNGGTLPVWRRDGKELFYLSADSKLMAVAISSGDTLQPSAPQPLFDVHTKGGGGIGTPSQFDVTPDGKRFLVNTAVAGSELSPIHVILNWPALLQKK